MRPRVFKAPFLVAALLPFSGCLGEAGGGNDLEAPEDEAGSQDEWNGFDRILIVDIHADIGYEYDIACAFGGGPALEREPGAMVLPGSERLDVSVRADPTFTGLQIGYVVDPDPAYDETGQDGISWLPMVRGEERLFVVEVPPEATETAGSPRLWTFYHRMQPLMESGMCYTGGGTGRWDVVVEAVRAAE